MSRRKRLKSLARGWTRRTLDNGRVAATVAAGLVRQRATGEDGNRLGEALVAQLDEMKGLALKLGQMASYMDGLLPPETAARLQKLQADVEPMDAVAVREALESSLQRSIDEAFESFESEPIAAASIGQVHRAVVDGREVAVKVQYPGVRATLEYDMSTLHRLGALASLGAAADGRQIVEELHARFAEECDYLHEAQNLSEARTKLGTDQVWIPEVIASHTTETVLTTEWAESCSLQDFIDDSTQDERDALGELLFATTFHGIFAHGIFNADPHPGNFRVVRAPELRLVMLDWGCMCRFDDAHLAGWKQLAHVMLDGRRADLEEAVMACGFTVPGQKYDYDRHYEMMRYLYRPFLTPGFRYDSAYVRESFELLGPRESNMRRARLPPRWVMANRLQWGLNSVLAMLNAGGPFDAHFAAAVGHPA